jgi:hypothetical protein
MHHIAIRVNDFNIEFWVRSSEAVLFPLLHRPGSTRGTLIWVFNDTLGRGIITVGIKEDDWKSF